MRKVSCGLLEQPTTSSTINFGQPSLRSTLVSLLFSGAELRQLLASTFRRIIKSWIDKANQRPRDAVYAMTVHSRAVHSMSALIDDKSVQAYEKHCTIRRR